MISIVTNTAHTGRGARLRSYVGGAPTCVVIDVVDAPVMDQKSALVTGDFAGSPPGELRAG